ncbi:MAG: hypothetical protein PHW53_01245 [Patescibacteria group bacterium]|nr:hypothetical protein [Patescibacteria group bacterium]
MKIRPAHLIIGSIVLFILDFLTLANDTIFPNREPKGIATVIVFGCALTFIAGTAWAIFRLIFKGKRSRKATTAAAPPAIAPEKSRFSLTTLEIVFNRIFAVLLILSAPLLLFNPFTVPTVVIFVVFALFLFFAKRYHPVINAIFALIALGVYFIPLPIDWGFFLGLKEWRMGGFVFHPIIIFFYLSPLIFISLSARNILGNILSFFKPNTRWRNLLFFLSLITAIIVILAYPLLSSIKLRERAMEDDDGSSQLSYALTKQELKIEPGKSGSSSSALARRYYTARFDPATKKYIYRLNLADPLSASIEFTAVETDGEKINFTTDSRIQCLNCQKDTSDPYGLVFPAGKNIDFTLTSDKLIMAIKFTEPGDKVAKFIFWK